MTYRVQLLETSESFEVGGGETVLDAALREEVRLPHECTLGGCGTCRVKLLEGRVTYDEFPMALTPEEAEQGFVLTCQAHPQSDLVISTERALPAASEPARHTAVIRELRPFSDDVVHLALELPEAGSFIYRPGQYMNVFLEDGSHRSFSMASVPNGGLVDFHIRRIPDGRFTAGRLAELRPGDTLEVELPLGTFCYHAEDYRPLILVATGTGISPIKCILESLLDDPDCPPVSLYWGMRTAADLYLDEEIRSWADRLYEFQYVPVLSRAPSSWPGRRGHVQHAVLQDFDDFSEHAFYLCGAPAMIHDAKQAFLGKGASVDHIYVDGFSFQHH
ncbi:MAG TPA: 2Fe-2S iron-sulfur cluster-binding protein [Rhodocyclaceae bacterium]|nr:2Fe-2S iron-sulfur cluster-binding protein [Rhodocyclaceae bacterium]